MLNCAPTWAPKSVSQKAAPCKNRSFFLGGLAVKDSMTDLAGKDSMADHPPNKKLRFFRCDLKQSLQQQEMKLSFLPLGDFKSP